MTTITETTIIDGMLFNKVKQATFVFRAINNSLRQQILLLLEQHSRLTVTQILIHLRLLQSVTSQHLAILRRAGIVNTSRQGKLIYYEINHSRLKEINQVLKSLLKQEL